MDELPEVSPATLRVRYAAVATVGILLAAMLTGWMWTLARSPRGDTSRLGIHGPYSGGTMMQLPELRAAGGFPVDSVWAGSSGFAAGLRPGDLIVAVDGKRLDRDPGALHRRLLRGRDGEVASVAWRREGVEHAASIALTAPRAARWTMHAGALTFTIAPTAARWLLWGTDLLVPLLILLIAVPLGLLRCRDTIAFRVSIFLLAAAIFELPESIHFLGAWPAPLLAGIEAIVGICLPVAAYFSIRTLGRFPHATPFGARFQRWLRWLVPFVVAYGIIRAAGVGALILVGWGTLSRFASGVTNEWRDTAFITVWCLTGLPLLIAQRLSVRGRPLARLRIIESGLIAMLAGGLWLTILSPAGFLFRIFKPEGRLLPIVLWSVDQFVPILLLAILPLSIAHAVVARRVFGISFIIRRGLRALLLSRGVLVLECLLLFWILLASLRQGAARLGGSPPVLAGVAAVTSLAVMLGFTRVNRPLMHAIDRRFFRESYDARRVLMTLAEQVSQIRERGEVLRRTGEAVIAALHPARLAFFLAADATTEPQLAWAGSATEGGMAATLELFLPLRSSSELVGSMALAGKLSEEPYSQEDKELLHTVATQVGLALEIAALLEVAKREAEQSKELEIAHRVQQNLFPTEMPAPPGWDIAAVCRPAKAVGGDYIDVFTVGSDRLAFAVGDVSGKGAGPALVMAGVHAVIRSRLPQDPDDLSGLAAALNRHLILSTAPEMFITLFLGVVDIRTGELRYVNGGHPAPVLARIGGGAPVRLETSSPLVGCVPDATFDEGRTVLEPGSLLLVFSDGVTEAMNETDEIYDEPRVEEAVREAVDLPARDALDRLLASVDAFAGAREQADDISLVVIRRTP